MEIVKLPVGETASLDSDCIKLIPTTGCYRLEGSLLLQSEDADNDQSMALVDGAPYESIDAAKAAGLAWAAEHGVEKLT